jgi:hypothetical protein
VKASFPANPRWTGTEGETVFRDPAYPNDPRAPKWRGWSLDGTSLGVCEAVNIEQAAAKFKTSFPDRFDVVTTAFRGAEVTVR